MDYDEEVEFFPLTAGYSSLEEITEARFRAKQAFQDKSFRIGNGESFPEVTQQDKNEALGIFLEQPDAPIRPTTPGAAKALNALLKKFDYTLANASNKMRQYVLYKLFEIAENEDPRLAIKAIEMLGKVSEIGLFTTKIEVAATNKPTGELELELSSLLNTYSLGELGAMDIEYEELTDEELTGGAEEPKPQEFESVDSERPADV
jgi:hypothetical protein